MTCVRLMNRLLKFKLYESKWNLKTEQSLVKFLITPFLNFTVFYQNNRYNFLSKLEWLKYWLVGIDIALYSYVEKR